MNPLRAVKTRLDRFRSWRRSPEGEPFRRDIAWTREWMLQGWGRAWLAALVLIYLLRARVWYFMWNSTPEIPSLPQSARDSGLPTFLSAPLTAILSEPLVFAICWTGWLYLFKRRALEPISRGRIQDVLVTDLALADLLPALIVAPVIWLAIVASVRPLMSAIVPILMPDSIRIIPALHANWLAAYTDRLNFRLGRFVVDIFEGAFLTTFVLWNVLSRPRLIWVGTFAVVGYYIYFAIGTIVGLTLYPVVRTYSDPVITPNPITAAAVRYLGVWIMVAPMCLFIALLTRHYLGKLRSPAARLRFIRSMERGRSAG